MDQRFGMTCSEIDHQPTSGIYHLAADIVDGAGQCYIMIPPQGFDLQGEPVGWEGRTDILETVVPTMWGPNAIDLAVVTLTVDEFGKAAAAA